MNKCNKCGLLFGNGGLTIHNRKCNLNHLIIQRIKDDYIDGISIMKLVKKYSINKTLVSVIIGDLVRDKSKAGKIAHIKYPNKFKHSVLTKNKLREIRLRWMKDNPDKTAWRQSNMSYPEKCFLDYLTKIGWDGKYHIIREKSFYPYFADFTFENEKIVVEIDGSQHLELERERKDIIKDSVINELGYIVVRFPAINIIKDIENSFIMLENILKSKALEVDTIKVGIFKYEKKKYVKKFETDIELSKHMSSSQRTVERPSYSILLEEIKELGYVGTGRKYNVSDNAIRKWLKAYEKYGKDF